MVNNKEGTLIKNCYYTGKMLSTDNMTIEQKYHEASRCIHNKYFYGCGIVRGLSVTKSGVDNIEIGSGIAIDKDGREIVLGEPVNISIYDIEGFDKNKTDKTGKVKALLKLEYKDKALDGNLEYDNKNERAEYIKADYKLSFDYDDDVGEGNNTKQEVLKNKLLSSPYEGNNLSNLKQKFMDMDLGEFEKLYYNFDDIYIAVLNIEKIDSNHVITAVNNNCRSYAAVPVKMQFIERLMEYYSMLPIYRQPNPFYFDIGGREYFTESLNIHTGIVSVDIPSLYSQNDSIISEEISHGFGQSDVYVYIYKDVSNEVSSEYGENSVIYGNEELFNGNKQSAVIKDSAVKVYRRKGTFKAAIRLKEPINKTYILLKWFALKIG